MRENIGPRNRLKERAQRITEKPKVILPENRGTNSRCGQSKGKQNPKPVTSSADRALPQGHDVSARAEGES